MVGLFKLLLCFSLEAAAGVLFLGLVHTVGGDPLTSAVALHLLIARYHLNDLIHRIALGNLRLFHVKHTN